MSRNRASFKWFRSIDKITFFLVVIIIVIGFVLIASSGHVVAKKISLNPNYFIQNHVLNVCLSLILMVFFSCLSQKQVKVLCSILFLCVVLLVVLTLIKSTNIKGAKRWVNLIGFSLQPSEFLKPFFAVVSAWLLSVNVKNWSYVLFLYLLVSGLLLLQPDFGMFFIVSVIFFTVIFVSRIPVIFLPLLFGVFLVIACCSYIFIPHVKHRIDNFLDKKPGSNFQVEKAMESFSRGGFFGVGPSEGKVKLNLPDAHTDFIFSVAGEEFGLFFTFSIVLIYFILIMHNILKFAKAEDEFKIIAAAGIINYLAAQSLINISVNLHILPTKGMTLPFISYGGSSVMASSISIGIILALGRKNYAVDFKRYE